MVPVVGVDVLVDPPGGVATTVAGRAEEDLRPYGGTTSPLNMH
jgi:hypothetical protein